MFPQFFPALHSHSTTAEKLSLRENGEGMERLSPSWYLASVFLGLHEPVPFSSNILFRSHSCSICTFSSQLHLRSPATMHSCVMIFQLPIGLHTHDLPFSLSYESLKEPSVVNLWHCSCLVLKVQHANCESVPATGLLSSFLYILLHRTLQLDISSNAHQTEFPLSSEGYCFQPIPSAILMRNTGLHAIYHP